MHAVPWQARSEARYSFAATLNLRASRRSLAVGPVGGRRSRDASHLDVCRSATTAAREASSLARSRARCLVRAGLPTWAMPPVELAPGSAASPSCNPDCGAPSGCQLPWGANARSVRSGLVVVEGACASRLRHNCLHPEESLRMRTMVFPDASAVRTS